MVEPIHLSLPAAVIFDMDGVLVDSNPFHLREWAEFLRKHHVPFDSESLARAVLGHHSEYTFGNFFGDSLSPDEKHSFEAQLGARFRSVFAPSAQPFAGVRRLIKECHEQGVLLAIASSATVDEVNAVVDAIGLRPYFREIVTGSEISRPKPYPEIYVRTTAKLRLAPRVCVALEDSFVGIEAAKSAGMKCLGVASSFPAEALLVLTDADAVVCNLETVNLATLGRLFGGAAQASKRL